MGWYRAYVTWTVAVVGWLVYASFAGWTWASVDEVKQVPKSVRDNPGSYRAHYASYRRYHWGK